MRYLLLLLAAAGGVANATATTEVEGTWQYADGDSFFQVRLQHGGQCLLSAGTSSSPGYMVQCTYKVHWPCVDVRWIRDNEGNPAQPLRLFLIAGGDLMRIEGEPRRPLLRVSDHGGPDPRVNLSEPGALPALAARDPTGYRKVTEMIDVARKYGCRGAAVGYIQSLVRIDFVSCGPPETLIGFQLRDGSYVLHIPLPGQR